MISDYRPRLNSIFFNLSEGEASDRELKYTRFHVPVLPRPLVIIGGKFWKIYSFENYQSNIKN